MNKQTKILIGVGITATAAYLILKKGNYLNATAKIPKLTKVKKSVDPYDWFYGLTKDISYEVYKDTPLQKAKKWFDSFF